MPILILEFPPAPPITVIYPASESEKIDSVFLLNSLNSVMLDLLNDLVCLYDDLVIEFTEKKLTTAGFWSSDKHEIQIRSSLSLEATLQTLIFECCNAFNPAFRKNININMFENADDYANEIEKIEHDSYLQAFAIYQHGIETADWPKPEDTEKFTESLSFDIWMKKAKQKNNFYNGVDSHFEIYTNFFKRNRNVNNDCNEEMLSFKKR